MSRSSLRQHDSTTTAMMTAMIQQDTFPTPPSSASTPPTVAPSTSTLHDAPPPRKRPRLNPPSANPAIATPTHDEQPPDTPGDVSSGLTVSVPRIRIKYAAESSRRTSSRLGGRMSGGDDTLESEMEGEEEEEEEEEMSTPMHETEEVKEEGGGWQDEHVCEMVEGAENWRIVGLLNVGNTCFTNAVLQVFSQTEILGEWFIRRFKYIPPPITAITNPLTSADLTTRGSRSKTRRNQVIEQEIPPPSSKSLCSSFSRLLRALHPAISPPTQRLGVYYHQPKKHRSDAKYTIAPREFLSTFNSVYPSFRKGESQEDAMEFFSKVRERLHDELLADLELELRKKGEEIESNEQWIMEKSPISDIFRGYYVTKRMCTVCNTARDAPLEETWQLPVAVPQQTPPTIPGTLQTYSLPDLIAHYGGVEKEVNVQCRHCGGNTPHDSRPSYLQTPRILVIQALRFLIPKSPLDNLSLSQSTLQDSESTTTGTESPPLTDSDTPAGAVPGPRKRVRRAQPAKRKVLKNPVHISFPLRGLDMTPYAREGDGAEEQEEEEVYDLFAVVEHVGKRMDGGHYIAYVRGKQAGEGGDAWWKCNDAKCWMVGAETVSSAQGYIWFYERRRQRGRTPEEWGAECVQGEEEGGVGEVGLPTPESEEKGTVEGERTRETEGSASGRKRDGSWEGRLRG